MRMKKIYTLVSAVILSASLWAQAPQKMSYQSVIRNASNDCKEDSKYARSILLNNCSRYIYFTKLGTQYYFEHSTQVDKFIYEMELRTGVGAHYKYAEHCREMLARWYEQYPGTKGMIFEGSAEPE